jgi:hypothetical protein
MTTIGPWLIARNVSAYQPRCSLKPSTKPKRPQILSPGRPPRSVGGRPVRGRRREALGGAAAADFVV